MLITDDRDSDYSTNVISFCLGCCVLLAIIFLRYIQDPSLLITEGGVRMGGDVYAEGDTMMLRANANIIGYFSIASITCSLVLLYYKKIRLIPFSIIFTVSFICGMYSLSRTWAIIAILTVLLYFLIQKKNRLPSLIILVAIAVIALSLLKNSSEIFGLFIERFTGDNIETGGRSCG